MRQQLKLLKDVFGLYVNRQKGMALLDRIESSDLSVEDRARVRHILRTMLQLPDTPGQQPDASEASTPSTLASQCRPRSSS